jgi:thiol-disulfide isomerase/thioredoxin
LWTKWSILYMMNLSEDLRLVRFRRLSMWFALLALTAALALGCRSGAARAAPEAASNAIQLTESPMPRLPIPSERTRAPEFPHTFSWVNTDRPFFIHDQLKGSVVLLDFWTYCCINCMHVLPDLEYLEHKYAGQPFMIIGVHSAKYDNESLRRNIETACARYHITHPVIVDENHRIWTEYGVQAWPTLVVIDSEGRVAAAFSGEGNRAALDTAVSALLQEGRKRGTLAAAPPVYLPKSRVPGASGLSFPGKVLAAPNGQFVFISDSDHDRVIIADPQGKVVAIAGSGETGREDGSFAAAQFDNPQGLAYDPAANVLYVADTDNHLIRRVDLSNDSVQTVCGTGRQVYDPSGGGPGLKQALNSPWDLALVDSVLYIAMAGNHQIWKFDLRTGVADAWVGSGAENIVDGVGTRASLAQPSGLTRKGDWLYFADSEVSALRRADLRTREVQTLIGTGLFDFGDRDGALDQALLQHPLGVAAWRNDVLIADTYNHKIKCVNEDQRTVSTLIGGAGPLKLYEPGGLSVHGDTLYVADTDHDRIIWYNLATGVGADFTLSGLHMASARMLDTTHVSETNALFKPGNDLHVRLAAQFPGGLHLNAEAPIFYAFLPEGIDTAGSREGQASVLPAEFVVPAAALRNDGEYMVTLSLAYCTDVNRGLCVPVTLRWRVKLNEDSRSANMLDLSASVAPM